MNTVTLALVITLSGLLLATRPVAVTPGHTDIRWYGGSEYQGNVTKYGEVFDENADTFASCVLDHNTLVRVTYNGRSKIVRCNDTGPNMVELTKGAFSHFAHNDVGVLRNAKIEILK